MKYNIEEKLEALMDAVEALLIQQGLSEEANKLYSTRSNHNPEDE